MKIKFECPFCGQRISATTDDIGVRTICPGCSKQFDVPDPDSKGKQKESKSFAPPPLLNESKKTATKTCPECGAEISAGEEKCKRCAEKEDKKPSSEEPETTDERKSSMVDALFMRGVVFFEARRALAVWIFCVLWPLLTLGLIGAVVWLLKHR